MGRFSTSPKSPRNMVPLEIVKFRTGLFSKLPEDTKERYAARYSIHKMEPIPFFVMTGCLQSGKEARVSLYDAIARILCYQKKKPLAWRDMKGTFAYIVDYINRMRMSGEVIPAGFSNFDKGEMGLISMAYKLIEEDEGEKDLIQTEINTLGYEFVTPFGTTMHFMFIERRAFTEYHYFITDLAWFLCNGPLWFLKGSNTHCVTKEDQKWLEINMDNLDTWDKLRGDFVPFVTATTPENFAKLSIL